MGDIPNGYKKTEIGLIPESWNVKKINYFLKVKHGKNQKEIVCMDGKYPILATGGEIGRTNSYLCNKPSVLIGRKGTIDKPQYMETPFWTVDTLFYTDIKQNVVPKWIYYMFWSIPWRKYNEATGVPSLSASSIEAINVLFPPLPEQQKIAEILSTWDTQIENLENLISKKIETKKGLMQNLLTGNVRFPGFEDEWKDFRFKEVFERVTCKNKDNNTNVLTISGQHGLINQEKFFSKQVASETLLGYYLLKKGEFAYNKSYSNGYPFGAIKRLDNYDEGVLSTLYICFKLKDQENNSEFYSQFFEGGQLNREIYKIAQEGARNHGLLNIGVGDFFNIPIPKPSAEEQQKIASVLSTQDKEIDLLKQKLELVKTQKKGLMQNLLTGKVRVNV